MSQLGGRACGHLRIDYRIAVLAERRELDRPIECRRQRVASSGLELGEHAFAKVRGATDGTSRGCKRACISLYAAAREHDVVRPVSETFRHRIRVRYGECDLQGVVFNANWLAYFDVLITELWRARIGDYLGMVDEGADMVVAEAAIRFRGPARFDDLVDFELVITRLGETSVSTRIEAAVDGQPAAEGAMRHVFVEPGTNTKRPIPDSIREALLPLVDEEAAGILER